MRAAVTQVPDVGGGGCLDGRTDGRTDGWMDTGEECWGEGDGHGAPLPTGLVCDADRLRCHL